MELYIDILTTLIGVFSGGLLTIWTSSLIERKKIKLDLEIKALYEVIPLLREYSLEVLEQGVYIVELRNIEDYSTPDKSNGKLGELLSVIDANKFILYEFSKKLEIINSKRIKIMLSWKEEKDKLQSFSEKYNESQITKLILNEEVVIFLDDNSKKYYELHEYIVELISEIQRYYLKNLFKKY